MGTNPVVHESPVVVEAPVVVGGPRLRAFADRALPEAPPSRVPRGPLACAYVGAFVAAMGFQLLIPAGWSRLDHLWAEDGGRFLYDAITQPLTTNLITPYGGYLHTVPRLVAELASVLPLGWAPVVFAVSAAVVRTLVALLVFAASGAHLRSLPVRIAHAALVVLLPVGNSEPLDNVTNLHWFLLYGAFWALLWRSAPRVPVAIFVVVAALTSSMGFLLVPVALVRLVLPRARVVSIVFLLGVALHCLAMANTVRLRYSDDRYEPLQVVLAALLRVPLAGFTGSEQVQRYYPAFGHLPLLVALLLAGLPILAALWWGNLAGRLLVVFSVGCGAVVITAALTSNWIHVLAVDFPGVVMTAQRYSLLSCLFMFTAVAVGLDALPRWRWARSAVWAGRIVIAAVLLVSIVQHIRVDAGVLTGVSWDQTVIQAHEQCAAGEPFGRFLLDPPGWLIDVPCGYLRK
ncbi:hypothetical protein ALI22I_21100 [Saccharothrix sp. ALI-22-I]|uniref:hypothetical protein n=1 Tax=Saccharothrix sp. ALI-22-I TaxID=1933778 RepID=UPI00097C0769|nr:hypothetical protein [Saccharothrix sp. ALI-22-I]ONI87701.1 hypothetical protein ALI22I_21100 [Saccharothrix sp. ALI-22-I]